MDLYVHSHTIVLIPRTYAGVPVAGAVELLYVLACNSSVRQALTLLGGDIAILLQMCSVASGFAFDSSDLQLRELLFNNKQCRVSLVVALHGPVYLNRRLT